MVSPPSSKHPLQLKIDTSKPQNTFFHIQPFLDCSYISLPCYQFTIQVSIWQMLHEASISLFATFNPGLICLAPVLSLFQSKSSSLFDKQNSDSNIHL